MLILLEGGQWGRRVETKAVTLIHHPRGGQGTGTMTRQPVAEPRPKHNTTTTTVLLCAADKTAANQMCIAEDPGKQTNARAPPPSEAAPLCSLLRGRKNTRGTKRAAASWIAGVSVTFSPQGHSFQVGHTVRC